MARDDAEDEEALRGSDPLFPEELSNIRSVDDTGSTSLTSFLTTPVPRKRTPTPGELPKREEVAAPPAVETSPDETPPEAAAPAEASGTPAPPEPASSPLPTRRPPMALAVVGAVIIGLGLAWMLGSGPETETETATATETATETETETETETVPADHLDESRGGEGPRPATPREGSPPTASALAPNPTPTPDPADDLAPLAVLPVTPPEILSQNTWARRNRAAEIRAEARALYGTQRWEAAREKLLLSLQWDPSNTDAQRNVSRTYQQMHEMETALSWSRRAVATDPSDPRSHELLGDQLLMMGHEAEALAAYEAGLEAAPDDPRLRVRVRRLTGDSP